MQSDFYRLMEGCRLKSVVPGLHRGVRALGLTLSEGMVLARDAHPVSGGHVTQKQNGQARNLFIMILQYCCFN